ncbi:hypothetical protein QFC22_001903 [Naganishia vaughanmartiniae]|uniref:Uncharacterized protein n=1 Tax=Naganishia vaughanmartiniae TaxID=1424756 RepID=A0ACC2XGF7_9TREE|nr:hypothetical protein QFC22_001903 [Naganishia vaughanmartiniae]
MWPLAPFTLFSTLLLLVTAAPTPKWLDGAEACSHIAQQTLNDPRDVVACLKSFPFREDFRQNVLAVAETAINFHTFETISLNAPPPFEDSTINLRAEFDRIRHQQYDTDYDFNVDLFFTVNRLQDGHTTWNPRCYVDVFQNMLPIPLVSLERKTLAEEPKQESIYVIPDADEFFATFLNGSFTRYYMARGIDIKRYAGAEVLSIEGQDPYAYVRKIADEYTGDFLDDGIRQSMAYASYRYIGGKWGQRIGDFAGPTVPTYTKHEIEVTLIPRGAQESETVKFPYVSTLIGKTFTDQASYWENNCAPTSRTNGVDYKLYMTPLVVPLTGNETTNVSSSLVDSATVLMERRAFAGLPDLNVRKEAIDLPPAFVPSTLNMSGSDAVTYFTMLPNTSVGVMVIGSFAPLDLYAWQQTVLDGINGLKSQGAEHLVIDVTNNGGGYVCDGLWLHRLLAGPSVDVNEGFEAAIRVNDLVEDMVLADMELAKSYNFSDIEPLYYSPGWKSVNGTKFGVQENFLYPLQNLSINGVPDTFSRRHANACSPFHVDPDVPTEIPFDHSKILVIGNGICASTCSAFTTLMQELHGVKIVNFGAAKGAHSGMIGGEVVEWRGLDSEFKTANLKTHPLAGPELLVNANFRINWRATYSYRKPDTFNSYNVAVADYSFPYTEETWNRPQAVWTFVAKEIFGVKIAA